METIEQLMEAVTLDDPAPASAEHLSPDLILERQLAEIINTIAINGINQHTPAWFAAKQWTVGGSSLATIMDIGYETLDQFIAGKIFEKPHVEEGIDAENTAAMNWGTVFEDVLCDYIRRAHGCIIAGTELFHRDPVREYLSYSPDGIGLYAVPTLMYQTEVKTAIGWKTETIVEKEKRIVLYEFKCPYARIPRGGVPEYYVPQVKMGLQMLRISHGVFVEAVFRRCPLTVLGFGPEYDRTLSSSNGTRVNRATGWGANPIACGVILFRGGDIGDAFPFGLDLGTAPKKILQLVLLRAAKKKYTMEHKIIMPDDQFETINAEDALVLPWKLFRVDTHLIEKEDGYIDPWLDRIVRVMDFVKELRANPTDDPRGEIKAFCVREGVRVK